MTTFPTAIEARAGSRNNVVIHSEIRAIEEAIYAAIETGVLNIDLKTTPFTDPLVSGSLLYYSVLFNDLDNRSIREQIEFVQKNFTDLGYSITPLKNTSSGNTFFWRIMW